MMELYTRSNSDLLGDDFPPYNINPYYTPEFVVGGFGGSSFLCNGGEDGRIATSVDFWYNNNNLVGVCINYNDGSSSGVQGSSKRSNTTLKIAPGEMITELTLWGNGEGTRTGKVQIKTSAGQNFSVGKTDVSGQDSFNAPVGSGLLTGIVGRAGSEVDMLGFIFLNPISSAVLTNISYLNAPSIGSANGINVTNLDGYRDSSNGGEKDWSFSNEVKRTTSQSWETSTSVEYFANVTVSAEIFGFGLEASAGWQTTSVTGYTTTQSDEVTIRWDTGGKLKSGQSVTSYATVRSASLTLSYTGQLLVQLVAGPSFAFNIQGKYTNVIYGYCTTQSTYDPPNEILTN